LHLEQTQIFNYFSHHNISIPPKHWRKLCKKYYSKCIGTFIVESEDLKEEVYMSQEYAYLLVYAAKKCKFDGFLINIEFKVKNAKKLS
jgi:hypothetical protein